MMIVQKAGHQVRVVATQHAVTFFNPEELTAPLYTDDREWRVKV
jgi:hypothetical protein